MKAWASCAALLLAACSSITISSDFEGASLGRVDRVSETHFRCRVPGQADQDGRNRQVTWYSFRLDGARGREVTIALTDLKGEYDYKSNFGGIDEKTPPVVSVDQKTWKHLGSRLARDREGGEMTFTVTPEADRVWVAHIEPYTASRLDRFLAEIRGRPELKDEVIGKTVEGRDLHLLTIGRGDRIVWLMCRQHSWESGTSFVGEGAVRYLLSDEARDLRERMTFKILPMMDPDGCARGGIRFNRHGYDLNRNWDTADPANPESRRLMPEICAAKQALLKDGAFSLFLTLHNQETGGWLSGSERHPDLATRFFAALKDKTVLGSAPRAPGPKPARGRATVYEYLQREHGLPAFILEQGIAHDAILGRLPTSEDRLRFGRELARVMAELVLAR